MFRVLQMFTPRKSVLNYAAKLQFIVVHFVVVNGLEIILKWENNCLFLSFVSFFAITTQINQ